MSLNIAQQCLNLRQLAMHRIPRILRCMIMNTLFTVRNIVLGLPLRLYTAKYRGRFLALLDIPRPNRDSKIRFSI